MRFGFFISLFCHVIVLIGGLFLFDENLESLPKTTIVPVNLVTISDNTNIRGAYTEKLSEETKTRFSASEAKYAEAKNNRNSKSFADEYNLANNNSKKYIFDLDKLSSMVDKSKDNTTPKLNSTISSPDNIDIIERSSKGEGNKMTVSEVNALQSAMYRCWRMPADAVNPQNLIVKLEVAMLPGGYVQNVEVINRLEQRQLDPSNAFWDVAEQRAVRAVSQCAPYSFLPVKKYNQWKKITLNFRPEL